MADPPELYPLTAAQAQEMDSRCEDHLAHPEDGMDWAAATAQILKQRRVRDSLSETIFDEQS